jgi:hypothetical protein
MLRILGSPKATCDGITRREILQVGGLALFGAVHQPLTQAATSRPAGRARSVVLIDLFGGPSHLDTFDPKPAAPVEIRGEFGSIATTVPGVRVSEHLPRMARWLHRVSLIRSLSHSYNSHNPYAVMTGYTGGSDRVDYFSKPTNHPSMGSVCMYAGLGRPGVPPYVVVPGFPGYSQGLRRAGPYGGYLGSQYNPLFSTCEPRFTRPVTDKDFYDHTLVPEGEPRLPSLSGDVTLDTLRRRRTLVEQIDQAATHLDEKVAGAMGQRRRQALELLQSPTARKAFDLSKETTATRERYGRQMVGSSVLLARRLVEVGVTLVTVHTETRANGHWDTHENNFNMLRHWLLPTLDRALTALLEDLDVRGLLATTLVVVMGDMGRSPRVNNKAGRNHWPQCGFCVLAGGGIKEGTMYGSSDGQGAYPRDLPVSPGDLAATIYRQVGVDPEMMVHDLTGRPNPISHGGRPIEVILT